MATALNARSGRRRWLETRLGRGLLFLGIVWSIEFAFLVPQNVLPLLLDQAIGWGLVSQEFTTDRQVRDEAAQRCAEPETAPTKGQTTADAGALQRARYAAFQMGRGFGIAAGTAFSGQSGQPERIALLLQEVRSQAIALGVPAPSCR
jgi:hypothetical protein